MRRHWFALLATGILTGCSSGAESDAKDSVSSIGVSRSVPEPDDPCNLVSQAEMERFIGPMLEPPYRVNQRRPDADGDGCLYRARDFRTVALEVDRENGEVGFRMLAGMGGKIEEALAGADVSTDTLDVHWDKIGRAFGQLIALKGPASVQVDPLGSRLDFPAQVKIIQIAVGRLDKPLPYDGSAAARNRKETVVQPRNPCTLVTRAEVEQLMGRLRADPHVSEEGDECVFPLAAEFLGTPIDQSLGVRWSDGFYALGQERMAMGAARNVMARDMGEDLPSLGENSAADKEPWDERITLLGGVITVVRRDVLLKTAASGVGGFDEAKALALLRAAARRIQADE